MTLRLMPDARVTTNLLDKCREGTGTSAAAPANTTAACSPPAPSLKLPHIRRHGTDGSTAGINQLIRLERQPGLNQRTRLRHHQQREVPVPTA